MTSALAERDGASSFRIHRVLAADHGPLMTWLNAGLRRGQSRRLEAEFETALPKADNPNDLSRHIVVRERGENASHALAHTIQVEAHGTRTTLGMIGMVYTEPQFRGRGAASLAIEEAVECLQSRGASVVILWSDLDAFYCRLGFHRAGIEHSYRLDAEQCAKLTATSHKQAVVRSPKPEDWPHLESLYDQKPSRQNRQPGTLRCLASAPECDTLVAWFDDSPIAYASMGRGDDLSGVVHEWAGESAGLVSCLEAFAQSHGEIALLEGPIPEASTLPLREAGIEKSVGTLGLMRILDVEQLFDAIVDGEEQLCHMRLTQNVHHSNAYTFSTGNTEVTLSHQSVLALFFGPSLPRSLQLSLEPDECKALRLRFPWPLFIWGFDSI